VAGITERLRFILELDADAAVRGFEGVAKTADKELGKTQDRIDKVGATMTKAGATMLAMGGIAAAGLVSAAGAASDLNEAVNVTNITFGDAADEIDAFAKTAADSLGQSERAAREATASFGGLLMNLGYTNDEAADTSIQLTRLASDLGSAFNKEPAQAVEALGQALRGEHEGIRQFNVLLSDQAVRQKAVEMGLARTTAEVDANGKAQATLALITEQTARYQGDFANTADGAANAQRRLTAQWEDFQAQLGQQVLPIMEDVLGAGNNLLTGVMGLNDATGGAVTTFATWGTGLLLAGGAVSTVAGQVIKMRDNFNNLPGPLNASRIAVAGFGLALAGIAWQTYSKFLSDQKVKIDRLADAYKNAIDEGVPFTEVLKDSAGESERFARVVERSGVGLERLALGISGTEADYQRLRDAVLANVEAWARSQDVVGGAQEKQRLLAEAVREAAEQLDRQRDGFNQQAEAAGRSASASAVASGVIRPLGDDARFAGDQFVYLGDKADDATDDINDLETAWGDLMRALDRDDAIDDAQKQMEEAFAAVYLGADDAETQIKEAIRAVEVLASTTGAFVNADMVAEIAVLVEQGQLDEALRKARLLQQIIVAQGQVQLTDPRADQQPKRRAVGGPVSAGAPYIVGEVGPELFVPGAGGMIVPNHRLGGGASTSAMGATYQITVNALDPQQAGRAVVDAIRSYERSNGKSWRSAA
jgi:hypothetical protein